MLVYAYIFCLVLGGVLLGASVLLGGDHDVDAGPDLDHDVDAGHDLDAGAHPHALAHADVDAGGLDVFLWPLRSVRFWTFFLAFFGLTGLVLHGLSLASPAVGLVLAIAVGALCGGGAAVAFRAAARDESGRASDSEDYVGKTVRVLVPVRAGGTGRVRLELRGNTVDVLATTDDDCFEAQEEAMIIEMDGTTARIARVER